MGVAVPSQRGMLEAAPIWKPFVNDGACENFEISNDPTSGDPILTFALADAPTVQQGALSWRCEGDRLFLKLPTDEGSTRELGFPGLTQDLQACLDRSLNLWVGALNSEGEIAAGGLVMKETIAPRKGYRT